jgi:DNA modification methylase
MSATRLILGDCLNVLPTLEPGSVDAVVTDPPYGLVEPRSGMKGIRRSGFMGKKWDAEVPGVPIWVAALHAIRPGGYLLAFGGTRTYHRLACAIEDAGWEIRDCLMWLYGTGWPKGPGCLKPSYEPVLLARKPGKVLPLGIDECRIGYASAEDYDRTATGVQAMYDHERDRKQSEGWHRPWMDKRPRTNHEDSITPSGRYPANLILDEEAASLLNAQSGQLKSGELLVGHKVTTHQHPGWDRPSHHGQVSTKDYGGDTGGASRFFYCSKASKEEKGQGNLHPTVKPLSLMLWLVKLVCPPGGTVLDPFMGSGTTGVACQALGRGFVGIEMDEHYHAIAQRRLAEAQGPLFTGTATNGSEFHPPSAPSQGSLFPEGE